MNSVKLLLISLLLFSISGVSLANDNNQSNAVVIPQIFEKAKQNDNWKLAFLTAKNAQIVFMSVSPATNPKNEIGKETHPFDQIIFIAKGQGKAILNGKSIMINPGDIVFIPQGVEHNVVNLSTKNPLKILSVYSSTDIPANSIYKTKADTQ